MKFFYSLILSMTLLISAAHSETIQSEFIPSESIAKIKEGDLIEATLRFWPIENADITQFKKLDKATLFNAFYLAQVISLGISQNNADVVELKALFIVKSAKPQSIYSFKYNDSLIELKIGEIKVEELKDKSQDYYILDQSLNSSKLWMIISGFGIFLLIIAVAKRVAIKNFIVGLKPDVLKKARKKYDTQFRVADKREDFELIYREKDKWLPLLVEKAPAHIEFLQIINQHQFKKDWGNEEYNEVRSAFDVIRRSFEK